MLVFSFIKEKNVSITKYLTEIILKMKKNTSKKIETFNSVKNTANGKHMRLLYSLGYKTKRRKYFHFIHWEILLPEKITTTYLYFSVSLVNTHYRRSPSLSLGFLSSF